MGKKYEGTGWQEETKSGTTYYRRGRVHGQDICITSHISAEDALKQYKEFVRPLIKEDADYSPDEKKEELKKEVSVSMYEFLDEEFDISGSTYKTMERVVRRQIVMPLYDGRKSLKVRELNKRMLEKAFNQSKKYCQDNIRKMYQFANKYFKDKYDRGFLPCNYMDGIKEIKSSHSKKKKYESPKEGMTDSFAIFSEDEIIKILKAALNLETRSDYTKKDQYYCCIAAFLFLTGLRNGELRALSKDLINFDDHYMGINFAISVEVEKSGDKIKSKEILSDTKSEHSNRTLGFNALTERIIEYMWLFNPSTNKTKKNYLVCREDGEFVSGKTIDRYFDRALKYAGVEKKGRGPHQMRHTFISYAIDKNELSPLKDKSILSISRYAGHADTTITLKRYSHIQQYAVKEVTYDPDTAIEILYENKLDKKKEKKKKGIIEDLEQLENAMKSAK
jgi:integrase